jgi:hypothetical protein
MKSLGLLAGFIPLIIYGILAGPSVRSVEVAIIVSLVALVVVAYNDLLDRFILAWATIFVFGSSLILIGAFNVTLLIPYMGIFIYLTLATASFGSIVAGMPFTLQYARRTVDKALWEHPLFRNVNLIMTAVWGSIFFANLVISGLVLVLPEYGWGFQVFTWLFLVSGVVFTVIYPGYIRKKVSGRSDPG